MLDVIKKKAGLMHFQMYRNEPGNDCNFVLVTVLSSKYMLNKGINSSYLLSGMEIYL